MKYKEEESTTSNTGDPIRGQSHKTFLLTLFVSYIFHNIATNVAHAYKMVWLTKSVSKFMLK